MSNQTATTTVYINNEAAKTALVEIEEKLNNVKKARQDAFEKGDLTAFAKIDKDVKQLEASGEKLKKKFFDVNGVLKDLSGASLKDLQRALAITNTELNKMRRDDPGWEAQRKKVEALKNAVNDAGAATKRGGENAGFFEKSWGGISGVIGKAIPIIGAAWGAIKGGEVVINSIDSLSDAWGRTIAGVNEGLGFLARSIATMDFSNFLTNLRSAIKAGRDYADTLDHLEDRNNALAIQESKLNGYILDRRLILRDATKSDQERVQAARDIIKAENELGETRKSIAQEAYDNEINVAMDRSKLSKKEIEDFMALSANMEVNLEKGKEYNKLLSREKQLHDDINSAIANRMSPDASVGKELDQVSEKIQNIGSETKKWGEHAKQADKINGDMRKRITDATVKLQAADQSARENTIKDQTRMNALLAEMEEDKVRKVKETAEVKKQVIQEAFDFEKFAYDLSTADLKKWAEDAEILYNQVLDAATKVSEELIPDTSVGDGLSAEKEKYDKVLENNKPDNLNTKIADLDAEQDILEKNKGVIREDEYEEAKKNIKLKKGMEYAQAAQTIAGALGDFVNAQQDAELAKLETNKQKELKAAGNNAELRKQIEEKYGKEELNIKKKYADKQFAAQVAQIVVAGALAIMQAFAQLGPIGGAIAAVLIGATTAMQISTANQERKRVKGLQVGGYTASSLSDSTPTDYVQYHANEFVANAHAVRNPTIKPVLNIIDMAQRSGTIQSINLPEAITSRGFQDGGFTAPQNPESGGTGSAKTDMLVQVMTATYQAINTLNQKLPLIKAEVNMEKFKESQIQDQARTNDITRK